LGALALFVLACGCAGNRPAPSSSEISEAPHRHRAVELKRGADVCALLASGESLCGEVITLSADSVAIGIVDSPHPDGRMVARADIVELSRRDDGGLGSIVGSLILLVGVTAIGLIGLFLAFPPNFG
jgi:hypothetical protein